MSSDLAHLATKLREGEAALRRRDPLAARQLFQEVIDGGYTPPPWLQIASANRALGDLQGEEAAVDQALAIDTRDPRALIMKGDCLAARGKEREAGMFYQTALRVAQDRPDLPPDVRSEVHRAEQADMMLRQKFEDHIRHRLAEAGFRRGTIPPIDQSLDILMGRQSIAWSGNVRYPQEPTNYYYPGIPVREFYDRSEFDWAPAVEQAAGAIEQELASVLREDGAFEPYVVQHPDLPANHHLLMNDPSWSAFFLIQNGQRVEENISRCPRTMEAVTRAPLAEITKRAPNVLFSLLRPGTHIPPHSGVMNTHLICHLPLIVPPDCAIRVGETTSGWETGKLLIFDDSIEHEAWNRSDQTRVVLIFEIWRPELDLDERRAVTELFAAVENYGIPADHREDSVIPAEPPPAGA